MWFRQDLRLTDNLAMHQACADACADSDALSDVENSKCNQGSASHDSTQKFTNNGLVRAIFFVTPRQWLLHDVAPIQIDFIQKNVLCLGQQLARLGVELDVITVASFDDVDNALINYIQQHDIDQVYASTEPEWNEVQRDKRLINAGVALTLFEQHCAIKPGIVLNQNGEMYKVFTPFSKRWKLLAQSLAFTPQALLLTDLPRRNQHASLHTHFSQANCQFNLSDDYPELPSSEQWPAGEQAASVTLHAFLNHNIAQYSQQRDFPALTGTSGLSAYLALGVISPTQCIAATLSYFPDVLHNDASPATSWINEIIWREFYRHLLVAFPRLSRGQNFNVQADNVVWRNDRDEFLAWCEGRTGYPIVDAAMRQLNKTGWMHNRLRMVVASFLTKHLLIDWRWGEKYFRQHLIDGDLAANNGGWQWSAGTGCDAQPYFRVFNPSLQSQRFDAKAGFILSYIPEISDWPLKSIHQPSAMLNQGMFALTSNSPHCATTSLADNHQGVLSDHYPAPIVDHQYARLRAIDRLSVLKRSR
ncbi:deoxyribodipyrimidine photo-lyase [Shewanella intestini]|uniref:Deoxyribodipyrimidine photo-lyase n=2 Tax=Shewanellaceae TaxID=267890 RepID=A0ABS5HY83_9GAMM|nr:deoxyribodipyrimidine photo-lyase [Shewanella intestini]MRG34858.1 deoxyribodipyrimidine photo-lyase [Shewanella sp. XMDDZSB0408]